LDTFVKNPEMKYIALLCSTCHAILLLLLLTTACDRKSGQAVSANNSPVQDSGTRSLSDDFKSYWFAGEAEISSYELQQARYDEMRDGHAVLIFVTEPFNPEKQVKADQSNPDNIQVLKLNRTKNFLTGIYPYSIMNSTFYPVFLRQHAIKLSASVQEWCGHVYTQLNNRGAFSIESHSYFEQEADQHLNLEMSPLEDEIWTQIRIEPGNLPVGNFKMLPSLEYIRLGHQEIKAYSTNATLSEEDTLTSYELSYPKLERTVRIQFLTAFPHTIESWSESYKSGFGPDAKMMHSRAKRIKTLKTAYWQKNGNKDVILRDSLGL
jgi:hypothetical protein